MTFAVCILEKKQISFVNETISENVFMPSEPPCENLVNVAGSFGQIFLVHVIPQAVLLCSDRYRNSGSLGMPVVNIHMVPLFQKIYC